MKYLIQQSEQKTTQQGKPFIKATLKDEIGQVIDNVSIWSDFPNFSGLSPGTVTSGIVETNARGYKNLKPATINRVVRQQFPAPQTGQPRAQQSHQIERVDAIKLAQEKKYESISYFNAVNSAIELVSTMRSKLMSGNVNRGTMKQEIMYWRDWFIDEWKDYEAKGYKAQHSSDKEKEN